MKEQEDNKTTEEINVRIQNKNPKKDPITYHLRTIQDIADCVTSDNVKGFLKDFEICLHTLLLMKSLNNAAIQEGKIPTDTKILMPHIEWIDDWKPKRTRKKK